VRARATRLRNTCTARERRCAWCCPAIGRQCTCSVRTSRALAHPYVCTCAGRAHARTQGVRRSATSRPLGNVRVPRVVVGCSARGWRSICIALHLLRAAPRALRAYATGNERRAARSQRGVRWCAWGVRSARCSEIRVVRSDES